MDSGNHNRNLDQRQESKLSPSVTTEDKAYRGKFQPNVRQTTKSKQLFNSYLTIEKPWEGGFTCKREAETEEHSLEAWQGAWLGTAT